MITATVISGILSFIGISLILYYFLVDNDEIVVRIGTVLFFVCGVLTVVFAILSMHQQPETTKEYPASEYTLSYKITEFEGQRDTTYVIIPKKDKK